MVGPNSEATVIRVVVVDDHSVVRQGLTQLCSTTDDIVVVADAQDGASAITVVASAAPNVILMDLSMPGMDGVEATRHISAANPDVAIVILTSFSEEERILDAIDAGAVGYLLKDAEPEELLRGIRSAAAGESPFSPKAARALLGFGAQRQAAAALTTREREVLTCVAEGLANKAIARRLGISEKTVKAHLTSIFQRIGVTDRTSAALWAHRQGLGGADLTT
jgi:DNA-binding NarL/FixJ family response regulator